VTSGEGWDESAALFIPPLIDRADQKIGA